MKNMKLPVLFGMLLGAALAMNANAGAPQENANNRNVAGAHYKSSGQMRSEDEGCVISSATASQSAISAIVGPGRLDWVMLSSRTAANAFTLYDSSSTSAVNQIGPELYNVFVDSTGTAQPSAMEKLVRFVPPLRFSKGLTFKNTSATGGMVCARSDDGTND